MILDDNLFFNIDSEKKAYILGWIASDGSLGKNKVSIQLQKSDENFINITDGKLT